MSQHVQDAAVFERRLRPIYDNLESGNNRKALQETEKLLKKQPSFLCAKALKGLALLRLGRYEESNQFLKAVSQEKPTDDSTLQVLSFCYKELEQLHKIVELYAHAAKETPGNEELLAHLFISHVRMEDFKSQQSVALQLYKAQPKNAYYFWAVMSVVLQATRGPDSNKPDKRKIFLELSQRMTEKMIKENKLDSEQEILIYLHILKLQEKYQEALEFLETHISSHMQSIPITEKVNLLKLLKRWEDLKKLLTNLLNEEPDRWDYHKEYLNCYFALMDEVKSKENENENENDCNTLDSCHEFLCQLIETAPKKVRGPYMARLELHKRMRERDLNAKGLLGEFGDLIIEYFRLFGDKTCCTHDIALFLDSITLQERQEIASKLLLESGISSTTLPQNKEQMQKHICALQISRICGSHIDLELDHLLAFYTALKLHYEHGLSSFGKNLLATDMGPSDPYALLAANVMYDVSMKEQKSDYLFEALCLLQYVLRNSTSNFHVKLLSLKIYHMFGCILGAQEMYEYLEIKQIQLDSMGYVHCNLLPLSGRMPTARSIFDATLRFFTASYKERLEYVGLIYRFCTFSKLEEFMNFKERLTNSLHYVAISVEAQLCVFVSFYGNVQQNLGAYTSMSIDPADDRISWNELSDNRDLSALVRFDPKHLVNLDEERKESFDQEVEVLQIRSLLLRLIASYIDLFHQPPSGKHPKKSTPTTDKTKSKAEKLNTHNNKNESSEKNQNQSQNQVLNSNHHNNEPENNDDIDFNIKETDIVDLLTESWCGLFQRIRSMNYKPLSNRFLVNLLPTRLHLLLNIPYEKFFADLSQLVLDLFNDSKNLLNQSDIIQKNVINLVDICTRTIQDCNGATENGLWNRREMQNRIAAIIEIMSLYTFIVSVLNDKIQTLSKSKGKKKSADKKEKERSQIIHDLVRHLRTNLESCDTVIGNWKSPVLPRDLNSCMSDLSLKPEVEATLIADVASIFKESHDLMVSEFRNLLKDKIRMVAK